MNKNDAHTAPKETLNRKLNIKTQHYVNHLQPAKHGCHENVNLSIPKGQKNKTE